MQRRRWLKVAIGSGAIVALGGTGTAAWLRGDTPPVATFPDAATALAWIDALANDPTARSTTPWPLPQVLEHAAQSIEFSLDGYPSMKPELFRASVGALAFAAFSRRGRMHHDTGEPIPGAPKLAAIDASLAAQRLARALQRFEAWPAYSALAPHFAYGNLDKDQYRRAHLMHLADHARGIAREPA